MQGTSQKILFIITKSNWGGAQRYVYDLVTALPRGEFEVGVAFGQHGRLARELQQAGIAIYPILSLQRNVSLCADIYSFFELIRLFHTERPQIVHLNSSKAAGIGALAARLSGIPHIIFTAHGWPFWENRSILSRTLIYFFSWITALLAHKIIVVSDYDLEIAQKMPFIARKVTRIYNGIGPLTLGSGERIRNAFPPHTHITGTIGELTKNKNHIALIEEARGNRDMYVAIVGEGELRPWLEQKIREYDLKERVKLFGFIPAHEVLRGFDIFTLPSIKEGLPYVLIEARAAGLEIQANRVGGVGEILDAKDMQNFSLEQMVQKTLALYHS